MENEKIVQPIEIKIEKAAAIKDAKQVQKELIATFKDKGIGKETSLDMLEKSYADTLNLREKMFDNGTNYTEIQRLDQYLKGVEYAFDRISAGDIVNNTTKPVQEEPIVTEEDIDNAKELNTVLDEIPDKIDNAKKGTKEWSLSFKTLKKALNSTLISLFGVRTIWSALHKGMSTYLAQNDEANKKLQACYYAIGSLIAPVFERVVDLIVTAVAKLDSFLKALGLAGINMTNLNKKAKESQKTLAGFDELNNLSKATSEITNPFENINTDLSKAASLGIKFKEVFLDWENLTPESIVQKGFVLGGTVIGGIIGGALFGPTGAVVGATVGALLSLGLATKIFNMDGELQPGELVAGLGMVGTAIGTAVASLLLGPAAAAGAAVLGLALTVIIDLNFLWQRGVTDRSDYAKMKQNLAYEAKELGISTAEAMKLGLNGQLDNDEPILVKNFGDAGKNIIQGLTDGMQETAKKTDGTRKSIWQDMIDNFTNKFGLHSPSTVFKQYGVNIIQGLMNGLSEKFAQLKAWWSRLELPSFKVKTPHLTWTTTEASGWIANILSTLGLPTSLPKLNVSWYAKGGLFSGPQIIGVGEYANASSNPEVVAPLDKLAGMMSPDNSRVEELLQDLVTIVDTKEFKAYISQKEVGKAATNYINSQSRIMGGSLV